MRRGYVKQAWMPRYKTSAAAAADRFPSCCARIPESPCHPRCRATRRSAGFQTCSLKPCPTPNVKKGRPRREPTPTAFRWPVPSPKKRLESRFGNTRYDGGKLPRSRLRAPRPPSAVAKVASAASRVANVRKGLEHDRGAGLETRATTAPDAPGLLGALGVPDALGGRA
jgi:hypothetical protein